MKIRLKTKEEIKEAYEKEPVKNKIDLKEEIKIDCIDRVPNELFLVLSETLAFIEETNNKEVKK